MSTIQIKGARANNLKNIDLEIPRNKLVVITGLSGSGKSSLAFDTLYAEGQRRYVESLSSYARQFLGRMHKPECDFIKGIPPSIAIEQKVSSRNPRSTVGTSTEIYEYLRLLFARIGHTFSPVSGNEVRRQGPQDVVDNMLAHPEGTRFMVLCPLHIPSERTLPQQLDMCIKNGFTRIEYRNEVLRIEDCLEASEGWDGPIYIIIDRMVASHSADTVSRLTDSAETAFYEGQGECILEYLPEGKKESFSIRFEADGITFEEPTDGLFAFNSPMGACPECEGFGKILGIDEQLVIPNSSLSVYEGAVVCWRGEKMSEWKNEFILRAERYGFPIFTPYYELTQEQKDLLWHGDPRITDWREKVCIDSFFEMLREGQYKIQNRVMLARYKGKTTCPKCHGKRLRPEAEYVKIAGKSITDLVEIPISELIQWEPLQDEEALSAHEQKIARRLITEIRNRLQFLIDVGLGYLTLNRTSNSLSGGENQRINLATSLGSSLVGSLYILDEPSIGLHSRDTQRLISVLKQLRDLGNTVVVVEHDEEIMQAADWIIDMGPEAGRLGGEVVYQGELNEMNVLKDHALANRSHTVQFITGTDSIPVPPSRRPWNTSVQIKGARAHNLKGIDVNIPLHVMTCVTGVSGSGKSSLVRDILYLGMKRQLGQAADRPGEFAAMKGDINEIKSIEFVDQNPIGKSTRSNPVTYIKAWDEIRKLMANLPLSKQMGYSAGYFSFNTDGGRCEECKGEGTVTVEMQFMADLALECESCHGQRFKKDILDVRYEGCNVNDILQMTVNQAVEFFTEHKQQRIVNLLKPLQNVGLGYIKLGQSSSTLSGGENQRVKLAYFLSLDKQQPTMFIFDEPTTGLHLYDIKKLLAAFDALIARGHTIVIIEHNMDVIKCADHVIDLGPEGGDQGGYLTTYGTPEEVARCKDSYTGQHLKLKLEK